MGKQTDSPGTDSGYYRITSRGRARAASGEPPLRSRYLTDLLDLLETAGRSLRRRELRQFMPPDSLEMAICALTEKGLIELDEPFRPRERPQVRRDAVASGMRWRRLAD